MRTARARLCRTSTCACAAEPTPDAAGPTARFRHPKCGVAGPHQRRSKRPCFSRRGKLRRARTMKSISARKSPSSWGLVAKSWRKSGVCDASRAAVRAGCWGQGVDASRIVPAVRLRSSRRISPGTQANHWRQDFACRGRSAIASEASAREGTHKLQAAERLRCDFVNRPLIHTLIHSIRTRTEMHLVGSVLPADSKSPFKTVTRW